jgi:hypothetical protein
MKTKKFLMLALVALSFVACKKSDDTIDFPAQIDQVINELTLSFDSLNADLSANTAAIAQHVSDTAATRGKLLNMYNQSSFVDEFSFITPQGILQIIEPSEYYSEQGLDISGQDHVVKVFQTKLPVLSQTFQLVEGFEAAIIIHPILNNNQIAGALSCVLKPEVILGREILPFVEGQDFEIWVMEKGGNVLFDQDPEEIGLNVITDPVYADFPELIAAAELINDGESGKTSYSFYQTGTNIKVVKETYWKTLHICDNEWKIIWVIPVQL